MVVLECVIDHVLIDGGSTNQSSAPRYQRSRQFKLRVVLSSQCNEEDYLRSTTVEWSAVLQSAGKTVKLDSTSRQLIVLQNSLAYGTYQLNVIVVSSITA